MLFFLLVLNEPVPYFLTKCITVKGWSNFVHWAEVKSQCIGKLGILFTSLPDDSVEFNFEKYFLKTKIRLDFDFLALLAFSFPIGTLEMHLLKSIFRKVGKLPVWMPPPKMCQPQFESPNLPYMNVHIYRHYWMMPKWSTVLCLN